ncbi:MAG: leucine-rich repeat domain-containing protein [Ruminococcaceae bacterium]|nr:leucine-rich repeat domain-containing protein [Oscillospiraceae bacterium]
MVMMKTRSIWAVILSAVLPVIALCSCQSGPEIIPTSIPEGLNRIEIVMEGDQQEFGPVEETVYVIPKEMEVFNHQAVYNRGIRWIEVEEGNQHFVVADGVLFTKDMKKLIYCPIGRETVHYEIPSSVKIIGKAAFQNCRNMKSVTLPAGITEIGSSAFSNCMSLESIALPSELKTIPNNGFSHCISLEEIIIPEGVTTIGEYAFSGCKSLKSVTLPSTLTQIDAYAFQACESLTTISFPKNLKTIGKNAFYTCYRLESYPSGNLTIGENAFFETRYEKNQKDIFEITAEGILNKYNGTDSIVILPEGIVHITPGCFSDSEVTSLTVPESLKVFSTSAEEEYTIYSSALDGLNRQKLLMNSGKTFNEIIVHPDNPDYTVIDGVLYSKDLTNLILYPQGKPDKEFVIPDHVKVIGSCAFQNCNQLESVYIPDSVLSIQHEAFYECKSLQEVRIPEHMNERFDPQVFYGTPFFDLSGFQIVQ